MSKKQEPAQVVSQATTIEKNWFEEHGSLIAVLGTWAVMLGITVTLYTSLSSRTDAQVLAIRSEVDAIRQDMRDFHGRLERQDAEFKAFLMYGKEGKKDK